MNSNSKSNVGKTTTKRKQPPDADASNDGTIPIESTRAATTLPPLPSPAKLRKKMINNEKSKEREAPAPLSILSLPPEVWSLCLEFLSPTDLTIASTCLSRALSSVYAREQAAWGALTYIIFKLYGRIMRLERYPDDTWISL